MFKTKNPWLNLGSKTSYILPSDQLGVCELNTKAGNNDDFKILKDSIPEPFIGPILFAKVLLLALNPGHDDDDTYWQNKPDFKDKMLSNQRDGNIPFYLLDPLFKKSPAGDYWHKKLKRLIDIDEVGREVVQSNLAVAQWFPYHSKKFKPFSKNFSILESQKFTFKLVDAFIQRGGQVVVMRSYRLWNNSVQLPKNTIRLNNPRNPCVTPGNMKEGEFKIIVDILRNNN